jgi:hypothetical protein
MEKIKLMLLLLIATTTLNAQYYTNFSTSTFYDVNSTNDLHYDEGWTRDTSSMQIVNSEMEISIFKNSTYSLTTGFLPLRNGDIIYIDHRITNASGNGDLLISYVDSFNNIVSAKTISYNSANTQSTIDTVNVKLFGSYKIQLSYTKGNGNNQQRFILKDFSIINPIPLPIINRQREEIVSLNQLEDEEVIEVYNISKQRVFVGYKKDFLLQADKNTIYIIKDNKIVVQ